MTRIISGLLWAKPCTRPACIPKGRPRGKKRAGVKYEQDLARSIGKARHGQWFEFQDGNGHGYCQTDVLLELPDGVLIIEAKYTWTVQGHLQLEKLYKPVVSRALGKPVFGAVACKVLIDAVNRDWICRSLEETIERARQGETTVLHWLGGSLAPLRQGVPNAHLDLGLAAL